jgi:hypothetical protein
MSRTSELTEHAKTLGLDKHLHGNSGLEEHAGWISRAQAGKGLVVDRAMKRRMKEQGFAFDDKLDNRSVYVAEDVFPRFARYVEEREWKPDMQLLTKAFKAVWKSYAKPKEEGYLETATVNDVERKLHGTHSSGLPEMQQKAKVFQEDLARSNSIFNSHTAPPSCVSFIRVGAGEDGPRVRLIWGYPQSMTILEGILAVPIIDRFLGEGGSGPIAFGISKGALAGKLCHLESFNTRVSIDFSGFDASIHCWLIYRAFDILRTYIPRNPELDTIWKKVIKYFIYTHIVLPDGQRYGKRRGVPSGSWFTQLIDSLVALIAIQYAMQRRSRRTLADDQVMVLGDDCVFGTNENLTLPGIASALMELGLELNVEKSRISRYGQACHFLGHEWLKGFMTRPIKEIAQRLVYPERATAQTGTHWKTRAYAICTSCHNGLELYKEISHFRHLHDLDMELLPGVFPRLGFDAREPDVGWEDPAYTVAGESWLTRARI